MFKRHPFLACASVLAVTLTFSATAFAQEESIPKYEIGVGYSGLHTNSADSTLQRTGNGGAGYFEYNLNRTFGLVGDFGGYANTNTHDRLMTYMFGPRFNWRRGRLTAYAQFLFGGAYLWANPTYSQTQNAFATAAGGGVDYRLTDHIAIKPFQVEYLMTQLNSTNGFGSHQNGVRYSAGVVLRLGSK